MAPKSSRSIVANHVLLLYLRIMVLMTKVNLSAILTSTELLSIIICMYKLLLRSVLVDLLALGVKLVEVLLL